VVAEGFAQMDPDEVREWLDRDTRNLTLAVQSVIQATATFDEQKIAALGRAFRAGVTDSAKVDESLLVVIALGALERPHIDLLHVIACEEPPLWKEEDLEADERRYGSSRAWFVADLSKRLPHLREVMKALELTLRSSGITSRNESYGGPFSDARLTPLGRLCVDYLSIDPAAPMHVPAWSGPNRFQPSQMDFNAEPTTSPCPVLTNGRRSFGSQFSLAAARWSPFLLK
jgi:hypothetical protein